MSKAVRLLVPASLAAALLVLTTVLTPGFAGAFEGNTLARTSGDLYFFGRDGEIASDVDGSVQVYGGGAEVRGNIRGDLLVFGGDVVLHPGSMVNGNVIYAGGKLTGADRVSGRTHSLTTLQGAASSLSHTAVVVSLLLLWLAVAVLVTLFAGREVRYSSLEVRASAFYCFALGLVAFTSLVITAIVCSYLVSFVIGVPLLAILGAFAIVTKVYGLVAVFHAVGCIVAGSRNREQLASRRWLRGDLAMVVTGVLLLGALRLVPVAGTLIWSCASIFGIGCALATRFGRREPAFLAWRPAEA